MDNFVSASYDIAFKALFVRNKDLLRPFLSETIGVPLTANDKVEIRNPELTPDVADGKSCRLDVRADVGYRQFNIEMQARKEGFVSERVVYYWKLMYGEGFKAGDRYEDLAPTYSVNILDFKYFPFAKYHTRFSINEEEFHLRLNDALSFHFFELPKVPAELIPEDNMQMWMKLIKADSEEALEMVKATTRNPAIQQGAEAILELNGDSAVREQIFTRRKTLLDYGNDIAVAKLQGKNEGRIERDNEIFENMRRNGFTEEQIQLALGLGSDR